MYNDLCEYVNSVNPKNDLDVEKINIENITIVTSAVNSRINKKMVKQLIKLNNNDMRKIELSTESPVIREKLPRRRVGPIVELPGKRPKKAAILTNLYS